MEDFMSQDILGLLTGYQLLVIVHLFGLALGAGAAFFSDFLFTHILRGKDQLTQDKYEILRLTSRVVWLGLGILVFSGLLIFLGNSDRLLDSSKFLAKITIVAILTINGLLFHFKHIPLLKSCIGKNLRTNTKLKRQFKPLFVSGAISGVSWASAVILGAMRSIDYSYAVIMGVYLVLASAAAMTALAVHRILLGK